MALAREDLSFPNLKYPSLRDEGFKDGYQWLLGKSMDDGAEGLWRIHDKIYDFTSFIEKHPGGEDWLVLTKGTDITEAFECHHISKYPSEMLKFYYIRDANGPRNSPFTFKEEGFYRTLKTRVREELKTIPAKDYGARSKRLIDLMTAGIFVFSVAACSSSLMYLKLVAIFLAGLLLAWTTVCAHNFLHHKDNWRMYLFNLCGMDFKEWRITHALSHHLYPNTILDFEISAFEPIFHWLPSKSKSAFTRYAPWVYSILVYLLGTDMQVCKRAYSVVTGQIKFCKSYLLPLTIPFCMLMLSKASLSTILIDWVAIYHVSSFVFYLIGVNAAHHHPDIFHEGDDPHEDSDWGIHQLSAVMDRVDITGSHFRVMTHFGDHALHHMFPTLDHAVLPLLYPVLHKTSEEFRTKLRMTTQMDLLLGQFKQLARNVPNKRENNNKTDKLK